MNSFNTSIVNEIKTVIKYTLIQYREENNTLIRTMRQLAGEEIIFPEYSKQVSKTSNIVIYKYLKRWKDSSGVTASILVPNLNTTYYAENIIISMPLEANMQTTGSNEDSQTMMQIFQIHSPFKIYLKNTNYLSYIVKPTCEYFQNGENMVTRVNFKIENFIYSIGTTKTLEPEFILYKNSACTDEFDKVTIKITVYSSAQSTGD